MSTPRKALEIFEAAMVAMDCKGTNWYFESGAMKLVSGDVTSMEDLCTIGSVSSVRSARGQIPPSSSKGKCRTHLQWRNKTQSSMFFMSLESQRICCQLEVLQTKIVWSYLII
jgi:hypothetical protein